MTNTRSLVPIEEVRDAPEVAIEMDDLLLDRCEKHGVPALRFWESSTYFVVMGRSGKAEEEVWTQTCIEDGVPILTRSSGGGTVLQGPGCLNYALVLPFDFHPDFHSILGTTAWVMDRIQRAIDHLVPGVAIKGVSDLAMLRDNTWLKVSGNAQRRRYRSFLFHGTFLHHFDLDKISTYLKLPLRQPRYRHCRTHHAFVANLDISADTIVKSFLDSIKLN